ncbi:CRISP-associated protein Cas1 [Bifidobacterium bohemicum]|uniref:CRISPR-associated endonuclease Cas1 n=1 Tax=Bifidobacterium bohemicum DSM 22767 TaxID=1437606 RepID=A0A086ZEH7_9BIFI|nr:type I-C CRISPR-associated endonuclease Cas1c [Bifidobacterium bohemicum]KFI44927.1 CRISPR-associated protein Cas1 [Bifidobacterium bohemicum DSM 22767]SCB97621.1 CRISP-associated protein Cas1 [Bifidobacterium bohemicum]
MRRLLNTLFVLTEDAYLSLKNENVIVQVGDEKLAAVPLRSIEQILCFSYKGASPSLMGKCVEFGVNLSFFSPRGRYYCSILGEKNRNVLLRREQFRIADDETRSLPIAKSFILGKVFNCRWILERAKRDHAMRINVERVTQQSTLLHSAFAEIEGCSSISELRGIEGNAAKNYFLAFDDLVLRSKDDFYFEARSRRPPLDRLNALLSFVYTLLTQDCTAALQGVGLDPYVGFMHVDRPGRVSLALDLMEELRPVLADRFVLSLVNTGAVKPADFEEQENGGVFLNEKGRKVVLATWQKRKAEELTHPFLNEKMPWGLVPYVQSLLLMRTLRGDLDAYPPLMWK